MADFGFLGDILKGFIGADAISDITGDIESGRDAVQATLYGQGRGIGDATAGSLYGQVRDTAQFQPWSVTSGLGSTSYDPVTGQMTQNLKDRYQNFSTQLTGLAKDANQRAMTMDPAMSRLVNQQAQLGRSGYTSLGQQGNQFMDSASLARQRSMQSTAAREQQIYDRIRATQRPEEMRQREQMNANLFGTGRGGMFSDTYGGTPEQMAYNKARAEAMNTATVQAMGQAQQEMMNQGQLASQYGQMGASSLSQMANLRNQATQTSLGAFGQGLAGQQLYGQLGGQFGAQQYLPMEQLRADTAMGMQQGQITSGAQQNLAGLLAQIGIGGLTTDVNYSKVLGELGAAGAEAAGTAAGGFGSALAASGLFENILKGLFGD